MEDVHKMAESLKNLYLLTLLFLYTLALMLYVMKPGAQAVSNTAINGFATPLLI